MMSLGEKSKLQRRQILIGLGQGRICKNYVNIEKKTHVLYYIITKSLKLCQNNSNNLVL